MDLDMTQDVFAFQIVQDAFFPPFTVHEVTLGTIFRGGYFRVSRTFLVIYRV